jgi:hypothetical protein
MLYYGACQNEGSDSDSLVSSEGETIMQGYCVKCKATREMKDLTYTKAANGRTMAKGTCPVCGTKMNKFLSKEEAAKRK